MDDPTHRCYGGDWSGDEFDDEQVAEMGGRDEEKRELNDPKEEVCST